MRSTQSTIQAAPDQGIPRKIVYMGEKISIEHLPLGPEKPLDGMGCIDWALDWSEKMAAPPSNSQNLKVECP